MSFKHIMVDIETVGECVLAIGAVPFSISHDECGVAGRELWFNERCTLQANLAAGLEVDIDTYEWWLRQPKEAQEALLREPRHESLGQFCRAFTRYLCEQQGLANVSKLTLWAKPPRFDIVHLERMFERSGMGWPLRYAASNDLRTLLRLAKTLQLDDVFAIEPECKHDAVEDAAWQARQAVRVYEHLHAMRGGYAGG